MDGRMNLISPFHEDALQKFTSCLGKSRDYKADNYEVKYYVINN